MAMASLRKLRPFYVKKVVVECHTKTRLLRCIKLQAPFDELMSLDSSREDNFDIARDGRLMIPRGRGGVVLLRSARGSCSINFINDLMHVNHENIAITRDLFVHLDTLYATFDYLILPVHELWDWLCERWEVASALVQITQAAAYLSHLPFVFTMRSGYVSSCGEIKMSLHIEYNDHSDAIAQLGNCAYLLKVTSILMHDPAWLEERQELENAIRTEDLNNLVGNNDLGSGRRGEFLSEARHSSRLTPHVQMATARMLAKFGGTLPM